MGPDLSVVRGCSFPSKVQKIIAREDPLNWESCLFIALLEVHETVLGCPSDGKSLGVSSFLWTMEKQISIWLSRLTYASFPSVPFRIAF